MPFHDLNAPNRPTVLGTHQRTRDSPQPSPPIPPSPPPPPLPFPQADKTLKAFAPLQLDSLPEELQKTLAWLRKKKVSAARAFTRPLPPCYPRSCHAHPATPSLLPPTRHPAASHPHHATPPPTSPRPAPLHPHRPRVPNPSPLAVCRRRRYRQPRISRRRQRWAVTCGCFVSSLGRSLAHQLRGV